MPNHGYCTDDVARGLVVVLREPSVPPELRRLESDFFTFLVRAQLPDGRFHNRLSAAPECRWLDEVGSDDAIGRAIWALGAAAARGRSPGLRRRALTRFELGTDFCSPSPRANAGAVLGAVQVVESRPSHRAGRVLLERAAARLGTVSADPAWPWPETRLAYDNARLAESRIAAGVALRDQRLVDEGLRLLDWLVATETCGDHFSFTPHRGWTLGEPRPGFDQQPIEAGAMADACARAFDTTGEARWANVCVRAAAWFLGTNDVGLPLRDAEMGGCFDGLERDGLNRNQGAESTLALISALQQARRVQAALRSAASTSSPATVAAPTCRSDAP